MPTMTAPAYRTCPAYTKTYGPEVVDLAASVSLILDDAQRGLVDDWFSVRRGDEWNVTEGAIICPRQNLKTVALEAAVLAKLFLFGDRLITWTAHKYDTAQEAFLDLKGYVDNFDHLRRVVKSVSVAKGDESVELLTGERLQFLARTSHGGRGMSGDTLVLDEALKLQAPHMGALIPTLSARRGAQILYGSSAGDGPAAVLRALRDRGRAGDRRLAYTEFCAPKADCEVEGCPHTLDVAGCALDRDDLLHAANPALSLLDRLQFDYIRDTERRTMPPEEFARERLGWWDEPAITEAAFPPGIWAAGADPTSTIEGRPALAVSMTPDRSTVSLVAAGRRADGHLHVEVIRHGRAGAWFVDAVKQIARNHNSDVVVHPGHAIGSLLPDLEASPDKVRIQTMGSGDYARACGLFYDAVIEGRVHYPAPQPELTAAVEAAGRKAVGDSWRWSGADICALVAATQAVHRILTRPAGGRGRAIAID